MRENHLKMDGGCEWDDHLTAAGPAPYCQETDSLVPHAEEEKESRQPESSVWCVWGDLH